MLRELIRVWRTDNRTQMCSAINEFADMIGSVETVFTLAWDCFTGKVLAAEHRQKVKDADIVVNKHERSIRRLLAEHLAINPGQDVPGCLALMSLVKDAERIGDYAKNILGLLDLAGDGPVVTRYMDRLSAAQARLAGQLPLLRKAYVESRAELATPILDAYTAHKSDSKTVLADLCRDDLPTREAVATALLATYLRRIGSHLANIASGISYPIDKIDFVGHGTPEPNN